MIKNKLGKIAQKIFKKIIETIENDIKETTDPMHRDHNHGMRRALYLIKELQNNHE